MDDVDTDRFQTCPVSGRSIDTTDPTDYQTVVLGSTGQKLGVRVAADVSFQEVVAELQLIDGRLDDAETDGGQCAYGVTD